MNSLRRIATLGMTPFIALAAVGCGQAGLPTGVSRAAGVAAHQVDWSQAGALSTHLGHGGGKNRNRWHQPQGGNRGEDALAKMLANAQIEAKAPAGFVLSAENAPLRKLLDGKADAQRAKVAQQVLADASVMAAFGSWERQSPDARLTALKQIAAIEGQVMGFTPPPVQTKSGVPDGGTLAYFAPEAKGIGHVVLFPDAIAKGDKWQAIATVTHEMRHSYQDQLVRAAANHKIAEGSDDYTLALGYYNAEKVIAAVGGEDNLSYGDYCHLNMEFDAFQTGNKIGAIVSGGKADTSGLGFFDVQYNPQGQPFLSLSALEAKYGPAKLLEAVNAAETRLMQQASGRQTVTPQS